MTKIPGSGPTQSVAQFKQDNPTGIKNDAATQERLSKTGVDGKKILDTADANKDGKIEGNEELGKLWKQIDDFDVDGSRSTIDGKKPLAMLAAVKPPMATAPAGGADLYGDDGTLRKGAKGPEVKAAQENLIKAGYPLPKHGADGSFGDETTSAVKKFQTANKLAPTGELDANTTEKLKTAPPATTTTAPTGATAPVKPGNPASKVQFPEYDKMFKDGVMQTTLGVGFDEDGNDINLRRELVQGLADRGFEKLDVKNLTDDQLKKKGFDPSTINRGATYFAKPFKHEGKDVQALVKLVDRNTPDAKGKFADGMKKDDLILYTGHGRRGSGPDFDHANSDAGNYVIGKPSEAGHYKLGANDVSKQGALSNGYQMMMFDACNTNKYLDDLRSRPKNKDAGNLDVLASTRELPWSTSKSDILGTLDGVMGGKSIQDIKGALDRENAGSGKGPAFVADGFKGNSYRPSAQAQ